MKANITYNGTLIIKAENELESFAIANWAVVNREKYWDFKKLLINTNIDMFLADGLTHSEVIEQCEGRTVGGGA